MALCKIGPLGFPSGKIGNMVFYMLKGQAVCRSKGKAGKPSLKQKANREAMKVTMELLTPMKDFIKVSFKQEAEGSVKNAHNLATSYNKKQALTGEYPNIKVDYSKVILSNGTLEMAADLKISKGQDGLNLSWDAGVRGNGAVDDLLLVVLSHPTRKRASSFLNAARRGDGKCFIPLFEEWMIAEQMEVYVCLKSANEQLISDSTYVGNLNGVSESSSEKADKERYEAVKARFDLISGDYEQKRMGYTEGVLEPKAFRCLAREYHVLKDKLINLPGKPS